MRPEDLVSTIEVRDRNGRVVGTREIVKYPALLNRAHEEGLKRIETSLAQLPSESNAMTAVAHATVETAKGIFSGTGEASPENTTARVARHLISIAETRAKARALRDAVNIGVVSIEELLGDATNGGAIVQEAPAEPECGSGGPFPSAKPSEGANGAMSEAQRRFLFRLLSEQGIKGDAAQSYLLQAFGVTHLKDVSKAKASGLIDELQGSSA